jgi:hypothetical protein
LIDFIRLCRQFHVAYLDGHGHHHSRSGWVQLHCPLGCGKPNWTLGWSKDSGGFSCYRCGRLAFWQVVPPLLHLSERAAREVLKPFWSPRVKQPKLQNDPKPRQRELGPPCPAGPLGEPHLAYLSARGFSALETAAKWDLRGIGHLGGEWAWRILIPIRNEHYKTVAYQGRSIGEAKPKYRMTEDHLCLEDPKSLLYGIEEVDGDTVIVVEGPTGVWRLGPGTVATLGIGWHPAQANRLRRWKRRFLLFDPEPKAQKRARELAEFLAVFPGETEILSGFDTDPGDFSDELAAEIRKELRL